MIHAGDVGSREIITDLESLVCLTVVGGNIDPIDFLPSESELSLKSWKIFVRHIVWENDMPSNYIRRKVDLDKFEIVIFGHSHKPLC